MVEMTPQEPWEKPLYDALVFAITNTKWQSCFSNFSPPELARGELDGKFLAGMPATGALDLLEDFFLSYAHGDPDFNVRFPDGWEIVNSIKDELESRLSSDASGEITPQR